MMAMGPKAPIHGPHQHHQLIEGPTHLDIHHWAGYCKCGQQFRGVTAEDIYAKSQLHINRHNYHDHETVFAELSPPYSTIVADPPWRFASAATKADARRHYSTMPLDDICALPVESIAAADAHLWLWAVNGLMEEAHQVVRAWGFRPTTIVTWCKPAPGVGHYLRNNTEHIIFATRGNPMVPADKPLSTWYQWPRNEHSAKPDAFGDLVERVSPGPYVELFCRRPRFGWDSWGHGYELSEAAS